MSMTIPFTLVEGAVALPPLRPLGPLSQTLGREWALLPPNVSLRVELKALYAAMLRTFCLSSQAIRSMCRWEPLTAQTDGGAAAAIGTAVDALSQHGSAPAAAQVSPHTAGAAGSFAAAASATAGARPVARAPHHTSNLKLGSAVAIGGAAMLAWIVLDHPHREHTNAAAPVVNVPASARVVQQTAPAKPVMVASGNQTADAKSGNKPSADLTRSVNGDARGAQTTTVANRESVAPASATSIAAVATKPVAVASQSPASSPALAHAATPASSTPAVANRERAATQNVAITSATAAGPATTAATATAASTSPLAAKSIEVASSRSAAPVTTRRNTTATAPAATAATPTATTTAPTWTARHATSSAGSTVSRSASTNAKPSAAGDYSPFVPSARADGEYESVTTSARTYSTYGTPSANIAAPQRAQATQRSNMDANDTSWMGRMSQRRVTEVPELFSR
jgi:hypothetical protein